MKKIFAILMMILLTALPAYAVTLTGGGSEGGTGDVTSTSATQTWGDGTGPVVWTFSVTGTDPTISVATGAFTLNTDLALGANDITMTGSLGATGAGKLTKIWSVDAEFTNAPTVNGAAFKPADLAIASQAAGDILYFNGTNWIRLAKDVGKYLKSGDSAVSWDTPAGGGTVDVSGTPANHYWTGWTDADTIKGFSITASKPVCSDANGDPAVCAGTEGVWQVADADLTTWAGVTPGTGVATALAVNVGSAGAPVVNGGALGTPSSGTVTNLTGTASININGTVGATTPAAGKFTTLEASTSLAVTAAAATGGYIRLLEGTDNGTDYSSITGAADAGSYPSFTFSGSKGSEDLTLTAASDKWTIASTTGATVAITPATAITGALTLGAGAIIGAGNAAAGYVELREGTDNGNNYTRIAGLASQTGDNTLVVGKTYTDGKWCSYATATGFTCNEDAPAGSGDITAVGSCTSGSCATIGNADTSGGYIDFLEDSDNGTNYVRLKAPDSTADATVTLPNTTGTLAILGANTFTADQTITGNILPEAVNTRTIGSATAEWADLYLGDGAVINLGNDQDVTITHVADSGLTLAANSEDLTLAATANTWTVSSSTGVTDIKFQGAAAANAMNLATTGTILGAVKVLNAGATEGSGAHTYSPGAADIYGSMILITDSDSVTTVNLPDYQASADADHVKIGASVCVYNTVAKATIVDVAADDTITTTNGTTNAAGASVTGPATIGAFSCFMLVSASSDVGNWAQLGLNGAWPVTP